MTVTITPGFPATCAVDLWMWLNEPRSPNFDDFGARDYDAFAAELETRTRTERIWTIHLHGAIVGYLGFAPLSPIAGQFHGLVIAPAQRRKGVGRQAVQLAIQRLQSEGFEKFLTATFADNEPIRRMFLGLGFEQQGYLTAATLRDGKPLDLRILAFPGAQNVSSP